MDYDFWRTKPIMVKCIPIKVEGIQSEFKPPLGLRPRWIVDEHRLKEIKEAIERYCIAKTPIPTEWMEEFIEINKRLELRDNPTKEN
jgi:hypothetical protein